MNKRHPLNIGHRGAGGLAPGNTLAAFQVALDLDIDGVELDVHLCRTGEVVVIHNFTVDATTNGTGRVKDLSLAELQALDAGSHFAPRFAGERIPTLAQVFDLVGDRLLVNVELKSFSLRTDGLEAEVIRLIREHGLEQLVLVSSFNPFSLWRTRRLAPALELGLLYAHNLPMPLRRAWLAFLSHPEALHPDYPMVDEALMDRARARGQEVNTWTVNEPADMRRMIALEVHGIITDRPDVLLEIAGEQPGA
ncbi:MAG: glycerophosphodiester phosphodiesterase [Chloroflexi bacterium]|nr:glycerophosphodiester phosphodiesterase [Chloroflexota bacterium]MBU1747110.1 glycerophosphodiester phosphodiesterase [Chloroflexota bacterium]